MNRLEHAMLTIELSGLDHWWTEQPGNDAGRGPRSQGCRERHGQGDCVCVPGVRCNAAAFHLSGIRICSQGMNIIVILYTCSLSQQGQKDEKQQKKPAENAKSDGKKDAANKVEICSLVIW
jgi:hypothetical protein